MKDCSLSAIGKRIATLRNSKDWTQEELAKKLNISREKLAKMEIGMKDFKTGDITRLADVLDTDCDFLLRGIQTPKVGIHNVTGLSEQSINSIQLLYSHKQGKTIFKDAFDAFEKLVTASNFMSVLIRVANYSKSVEKYGELNGTNVERLLNPNAPKLNESEIQFLELVMAEKCFSEVVKSIPKASKYKGKKKESENK